MNEIEKKDNCLEDTDVLKTAKKINDAKKKAKRIIGVIVICVICFGLGALFFGHGTGLGGEELESPEDGTVTVNTIKKILKPASELVTGKYFYTNAVSDEDPISIKGLDLPGTTNKYVFTYDGTISAGYDLSKATVDVDNEKKTIFISMPKMEILSSEVDDKSFDIKYKSSSVFNDSDLERNKDTMAKCKERMEKKAMEDGNFVKLTKNNAETVLKSFLTTAGDTKKYKVEITFAED